VGRPPVRIIYTSRTHAQLKQVVQELVKTGFDLKLAILGSRDQTCINDDLKELTGQGKELECRLRIMRKNGLFCKYFHVLKFIIRA
jgi:regulator of telomere elongation helicase 1